MEKNILTLEILDRAITKIKELKGDEPILSAIKINPKDWAEATHTMDKLLGAPASVPKNVSFGIPVIETEELPEGVMVLVFDNGRKVIVEKYQ